MTLKQLPIRAGSEPVASRWRSRFTNPELISRATSSDRQNSPQVSSQLQMPHPRRMMRLPTIATQEQLPLVHQPTTTSPSTSDSWDENDDAFETPAPPSSPIGSDIPGSAFRRYRNPNVSPAETGMTRPSSIVRRFKNSNSGGSSSVEASPPPAFHQPPAVSKTPRISAACFSSGGSSSTETSPLLPRAKPAFRRLRNNSNSGGSSSTEASQPPAFRQPPAFSKTPRISAACFLSGGSSSTEASSLLPRERPRRLEFQPVSRVQANSAPVDKKFEQSSE